MKLTINLPFGTVGNAVKTAVHAPHAYIDRKVDEKLEAVVTKSLLNVADAMKERQSAKEK